MSIGYFSNKSKILLYFIGFVLILIVAAVDSITGDDVSFSIFYLIPIIFIAWYRNMTAGFIFSLLCASAWFYLESFKDYEYSSAAIPYWNALVRLGFFGIVVYLIAQLKDLKHNLEKKIEDRTIDLLKEIDDHKKSKEELLQKSELLRKLTGRIDSIMEEENTKIAREIHDELGQYLTGINLEINWIKKKYASSEDLYARTTNISEMVNETLKTVRKISSELRPRLLDQLGVIPAIESSLKDFEKRTHIKYRTEIQSENINLPHNLSTSFFRIFQEAITNISRHSRATMVKIRIFRNGNGSLHMIITDNGIGFESQEQNYNKNRSLGIIGMKERAIIMGGKLDIKSAPNTGTEVRLEIPLNNI